MPLISIVSPVYRAETIIDDFIKEVVKCVSIITDDFEIILIDDGSPDLSWERLEPHFRSDKRIKGIKLSRNFGQYNAITAGLSVARGEWTVVMDCDLQDRPEEIFNLYNKALEGFDLVLARRVERQDKFLKKMSSRIFFAILSYLTDTSQDSAISSFGIYHKKVINSILSMKDSSRYFPTMVRWVGFRCFEMDVIHSARISGESSYSWRKLIKLGIDNIVSFSDKPLRLTVLFGLSISMISFLLGIYYLLKYLSGNIDVRGFTSLIISIWFLSGVIISILGLVGLYIGKIFEKVKDRPIYIIQTSINC